MKIGQSPTMPNFIIIYLLFGVKMPTFSYFTVLYNILFNISSEKRKIYALLIFYIFKALLKYRIFEKN